MKPFLFVFFVLVLSPSIIQAQSCNMSSKWRLVWHDEFDSTAINLNNWTFDTGNGVGGWGNNELEYYTSQLVNATVNNNNLLIIARKEPHNGYNYTSARLKTQGLHSFTYGKIEARIKLPSDTANGQGLWPAFWMLGDTNITWAGNGEIDIMETTNSLPEAHGTAHWGIYPNNSESTGDTLCKTLAGYHIYTIIWCDSSITWLLDSVPYYYYTNINHVFKTPFKDFLIINMAVGGNWPGIPNAFSTFPDTMFVDWIRVYQSSNNLGIKDIPSYQSQLSISPNPCLNSTFIKLNDATLSTGNTYSLELDDIEGRKLRQVKFTGKQYELSSWDLSPGMYFVYVFDEMKQITGIGKLIVQ